METIGPENGIEITRRRLVELHPEYERAWDKSAHTQELLVGNTNALIEAHDAQEQTNTDVNARLAAVEARPPVPFPASG